MKASKTYSRRQALGGFAAAVSLVSIEAPGRSLAQLLFAPDGEARVRAVLRAHYGLDARHDEVVRAFYASLKRDGLHTHDGAFFEEKLADAQSAERLARYVVEEFAVSTNILAIDGDVSDQLIFTLV